MMVRLRQEKKLNSNNCFVVGTGLGRRTEVFTMPGFDPRSPSAEDSLYDPSSTVVPAHTPEVGRIAYFLLHTSIRIVNEQLCLAVYDKIFYI